MMKYSKWLNGAKVIHPRAVELAKNADIILQIKYLQPNFEGTKNIIQLVCKRCI
ncbi:MAG: hypothetical protein ACLTK8_01200 [Paeniclostridium sp.]